MQPIARILFLLGFSTAVVMAGGAALCTPPPVPGEPSPADGATSQSVFTTVQWNTSATSTTLTPSANPKILVFNGYAAAITLNNTLSALHDHFTNYTVEMTSATQPAELAAQLADKQVFLMPDQPNWTLDAMGWYGNTMNSVLHQFVRTGGLVVVCDGYPYGGPARFLNYAGLVAASSNNPGFADISVKLTSNHPITHDLPPTFTAKMVTVLYQNIGDAQALALDCATSAPIAAIKPMGLGNVLLLGWDYYHYNAEMGRLLANAVEGLSYARHVDPVQYDAYFGTTTTLTTARIKGSYESQNEPGTLAYNTKYYWKVVAHNADGDTTGPLWRFQTRPMPVPEVPGNPAPPDGQTFVSTTPQLTWNGGTVTATFSVRLDTVNPPVTQVATGLTAASYTPTLAFKTTYYWQVISHNATGDTAGPVWMFTTPTGPTMPTATLPLDGAMSVAVTTPLKWSTTAVQVSGGVQPKTEVLAFAAHCDSYEYNALVSAIQSQFTNFNITKLTTESTETLAAQLAGKQVFVIAAQNLVTQRPDVMAAYGRAAGPILRKFAQDGGLIIVHDTPDSGMCFNYANISNFLKNAGLMNVTTYGIWWDPHCITSASNCLTQGVAASFDTYSLYTCVYDVGDALTLIRHGSTNRTIAALKPMGAGAVLLLGWSYSDGSATDMKTLLANAIRNPAGVGFIDRYDVYFGTANPPTNKIAAWTFQNQFLPGPLKYATTYYWRVVAHNVLGDTTGTVWSFRTPEIVPAPNVPSLASPADKSTIATVTPTLSWYPGTVQATYTVKLDSVNPPANVVAAGLDTPGYTPPARLAAGMTYYWQVISHNETADTPGPVWSFTTPPAPVLTTAPTPANGSTTSPLEVKLRWNADQPKLNGVKVAVFNGYINEYNVGAFQNTVNIIRQYDTGCTITTTNAEDAAALDAQLADKQVFIIPDQYFWTANGMAAFGTSAGPALNDFVQRGGLLIVSDGYGTGLASLLANAGLMNVVNGQASNNTFASRAMTNAMTKTVVPKFTAYLTMAFTNSGDAQTIVTETSSSLPLVIGKPLGLGNVVAFGWSYGNYMNQTEMMNRLLANPVQYGVANYDVYLDTINPPAAKIATATMNTELSKRLEFGKTYYWRIVAHNAFGNTTSPVWTFHTSDLTAPATPSNPDPGDRSPNVSTQPRLAWAADPTSTAYDIKFGVANPPTTVIATNLTTSSCSPGTLSPTTTYYWQVTAKNVRGEAAGPVWSFTTIAEPNHPSPANGATSAAITSSLQWGTTTTLPAALPVQVLVWDPYSENFYLDDPLSNVTATLASIQARFGNVAFSYTKTLDAATLKAQLSGKQALLMMEECNMAGSAMSAMGTRFGPVLNEFAQAGGLIIVCDSGNPWGGYASLLTNAGVLNITYINPAGSFTAYRVMSNAITQGIPSSFTCSSAEMYSVSGVDILVKDNYKNPIAVYKQIGAGGVLVMGVNDLDKKGIMLANALQYVTLRAPVVACDVYFGTSNPPTTLVANGKLLVGQFSPGALAYSTTYYWRVVAHYPGGDVTGPVWSFRTINPPAPTVPSQPSPTDKAVFVPTSLNVGWNSTGVGARFTVKFGITSPPTLQVATDLAHTTYTARLTAWTTYYWQVTATNLGGTVAGPVWRLTTGGVPVTPSNPIPTNNNTNLATAVGLQWTGSPAGAETYDVYLGTTNPPATKLYSNTTSTKGSALGLKYQTTYYWKVVAHNALGDTAGPVWSFTTAKWTGVKDAGWGSYD